MGALLDRVEREGLICSAYTIGGFHSTLTLEDRAAAASAAGFRGLGCGFEQYQRELDAGRSDADIRAILENCGLAIPEVEFLYGWAGTGEGEGFPGIGKVDWRVAEQTLHGLADAVGAHHMNCGEDGFFGPLLPYDDLVDRWGGICDRAAVHGLTAVLEAMAWSELANITDTWHIVRDAARPNSGLLLDSWHFFLGGNELEQLREIPAERIKLIQLDDSKGRPEAELWRDTQHNRCVPGEGTLDLVGFLSTLDEHGVDAPISVEVLSADLRSLPPPEAARKAYDATVALMATVSR